MKFIKSTLRLTSQIKRPFTFTIPKPRLNPVTFLTSGFGAGYGLWFCSNKILAEEMAEFETDDTLE
jgi:hypothetical protein